MNRPPRPRRDALDALLSPRRRRLLQLSGALAWPLAGCGGAGPADDETARAGAAASRLQPLGINSGGTGSARTVVYAPVVTTDPLTVSGVTFDTADTSVTDDDGQPLGLADLAPGRSCRLQAGPVRGGRMPRATAQWVQLLPQLRGPVQSYDPSTGRFSVLGQRVDPTRRTLVTVALQPGTVVEVWGELDSVGGRTVATRVDPVAPAAWLVRGVLSALDRAQGRVHIGALYAVAAPGVLLPDTLAVGDRVRATLATEPASGTPLLLSLRSDARQLPDGTAAQLHGRVTRLLAARRFEVDGVPVDATRATVKTHGVSLVPGVHVEVEGRMRDGWLQATQVEAQPDELYELEGHIGSVDASGRLFVLRGITVAWDDATRFEGGTPRDLRADRAAAVKGWLSPDRTRLRAVQVHVDS